MVGASSPVAVKRPRKIDKRRLRRSAPRCPTHPTNEHIVFDGYDRQWSPIHGRPRYRCRLPGDKRGHVFRPAPVRHPTALHPHTGEECPHCEHVFDRHEGSKTPAEFLFAFHEIVEVLLEVGKGTSLRAASAKVRDQIHRRSQFAGQHISPGELSKEGNLAIGYIDQCADVVIDALAPAEWPKVIAIDSMPLKTGGYRDDRKVGNIEAGEIMVAIDCTTHDPKPCLIQVQGNKDAQSWIDFFNTLPGDPEWIVADLDRAIAKAVRLRWPRAVLFRSADHLMRLMLDNIALDGIPATVRIADPKKLKRPKRAIWPWNQPVQEFEPHPLVRAVKWCQTTPERWDEFKQLVEEHVPVGATKLREWMASNEALIGVQWRLRADHPGMPHGSGRVEGIIREHLGKHLKPRAGRYQNTRRLNRVLALMMLHLRRDDRREAYLGLLRQHFALRRPVRAWRSEQDHAGSSLSRLVFDAGIRAAEEAKRDELRRRALAKLRRYQEEDARRAAAGLPPLHTGKRRWGAGRPPKRSTKGLVVAAFSDLMRDWAWDLNIGLDPTSIPAGRHVKVLWRCHHDADHVWEVRPADRILGRTGCPYCMGQRTHPKESLAALHPDLVAEWHPANKLRPFEVLPGSGRKVKWRCERAGHEWEAYVFARAKQLNNCLECFREDQATALAGNQPAHMGTVIATADLASPPEMF